MAEYEVWVAVAAGRVIGLLAHHLGVVEQLYIDPPHQRQGVGTTLLRKAMTIYPDGFALFTHQRNKRARAFYEKHGLRAVVFGISPVPESEPDVKYAWDPPATSSLRT
jgi:ribosomal protein S18 acetylase RimI-like enzyme